MAHIHAWLSARFERLQALSNLPSKRVLHVVCYLLVIVTGALYIALQETNEALRQMRLPGSPSGGAIRFTLEWDGRNALDNVAEVRRSWANYATQMRGTHLFADPFVIVDRVFWLSTAFILSYSILLVVVLMMAARFRPRHTGIDPRLGAVRRRMLRIPLMLVLPSAVVNLAEALAVRAAYLDGSRTAVAIGPVPIGATLSALTLLLTVAVGIPLLVAGLGTAYESMPLREALTASRVILLIVAGAVLLLLTGIGADQVDDVIRAWNWWYALFATLTMIVAALVVVGTITDLTGVSTGPPSPDYGDDPQPVLLRVVLILGALGGLCWAVGLGWGLLIPAGMFLMLALLSAPIARFMPVLKRADQDASQTGRDAVARQGVLISRIAGASLSVVLIWVLVRAATYRLDVRLGEAQGAWVATLGVTSVLLAAVGIGILLKRDPLGHSRVVWGTLGLAAAITSLATLVPPWSVTLPTTLGTVAVLMLGLAGGAAGYTAAAKAIRRRTARGLRLVPALRILGLTRFPVITFGLIWMVLVWTFDPGGFHNIRTIPAAQPGPPPTLEQAYRSWLAAGSSPVPPGAARPLVLVAAQGGGIRAAVWTTLVMECVFGPGPVAQSEGCTGQGTDATPAEETRAVRRQALPVFLASGSSGGSLGLAEWTARRVDLAEGGTTAAQAPRRAETALSADFVAPELARLLFGDGSHLFLAHRMADRAAVLESAWERPWPEGRVGMARGLREAYQLANGTPGQWRVPILTLNGMRVQDGCRMITSPVDFHLSVFGRSAGRAPEGDLDSPSGTVCGVDSNAHSVLTRVLARTMELVDSLCPDTDVALSTAAHLSARFPFVSPTARVPRGDCTDSAGLLPRGSVSYVTDGGLFDNSGAATAGAVWRALAPIAATDEKVGKPCVVPLFLQIDNSTQGEAWPRADPPPFELLAPATALLAEVDSRQAVARGNAETDFGTPRSPAGSPVRASGKVIDSRYFQVALTGQPGPDPPLGWTLSDSTVDNMRAQLASETNRATIAKLRHLLSTPLHCG